MREIVSVWDGRFPWASIAHAVEYYEGVPEVVVVPVAPARLFVVDGVTVAVRESEDSPGVACRGHQDVDGDAKALWLARARRGDSSTRCARSE